MSLISPLFASKAGKCFNLGCNCRQQPRMLADASSAREGSMSVEPSYRIFILAMILMMGFAATASAKPGKHKDSSSFSVGCLSNDAILQTDAGLLGSQPPA